MGNKKVKKSPSFQFYSGDWLRDPALRACSPSTRGTWIDMICFMDQSIKRGFFLAGNHIPTDEIAARMLGLSIEEYRVTKTELVQFNVCSVDENGAIFSRRMVKDEKERKAWRKRQNLHRSAKYNINQELTDDACHDDVTPDVTPKSRSSSSSSSSSSSYNNKNTFLSDSDEYRLASLLFDLIKQRSPKHKPPNLQAWAKEVDLLIRLDGRSPPEIEETIRAVQADTFWQNNILSVSKLREKYDQLRLKLTGGSNATGRQNFGNEFKWQSKQEVRHARNLEALRAYGERVGVFDREGVHVGDSGNVDLLLESGRDSGQAECVEVVTERPDGRAVFGGS